MSNLIIDNLESELRAAVEKPIDPATDERAVLLDVMDSARWEAWAIRASLDCILPVFAPLVNLPRIILGLQFIDDFAAGIKLLTPRGRRRMFEMMACAPVIVRKPLMLTDPITGEYGPWPAAA